MIYFVRLEIYGFLDALHTDIVMIKYRPLALKFCLVVYLHIKSEFVTPYLSMQLCSLVNRGHLSDAQMPARGS